MNIGNKWRFIYLMAFSISKRKEKKHLNIRILGKAWIHGKGTFEDVR